MSEEPGSGPSTRYLVPAAEYRSEEVVGRSRFLTVLDRARDPEEARAAVERLRGEFPDATHHCWAFVAGPPGSTASVGMSDDGEPHGTAGRPILEQLLHSGVGEVVAVSVRWFGGRKLGTGGLARAYSGGVGLALEGLETVERVERVRRRVRVGYPHVDPLRRILDELEAVVVDEAYGESVRYLVRVPSGRAEELGRRVADLTRGEGSVEEV